MSGRHRTKPSRSNLLVGSIAASVGVSSVLAATIVELVAPDASSAAAQPAPVQRAAMPQPVTAQGTVIAVTSDSLTAQSPNGVTQTFAITPSTNTITPVEVNDEVTVVGTRRGSSVVATAVAEQSAVGSQGRPMDYGL